MNYEEARNSIETGDLIAMRDGGHLLGKMTQVVTDSPYTHTGVAVWLGSRLFMADLNSGRNALHAVSAEAQLADFDAFDPPPGLDRARIEAAIYDWLANPISYGMLAFVVIGIKCALKIKAFIHWRKIIVCSGGSVSIYEAAGWSEHSRMISPGELVAELGLPKIQVRQQAAAEMIST